jgi:uncharacterized SAM-binding protein YcdF (DUF218 family)
LPIRARSRPRAAGAGIWRHWSLWAWFVLALVFCAGGVGLWKSGRLLVREDGFQKARWAVVMAGESRDSERADAAIRMFQEGRIDTLVLSSMRIFKDRYQSELQMDFYFDQGVPRGRLFEYRHEASSTQEEAGMLVRQFRLQNLDTVVIITSNYHTARTRRIFRKLAQGYPVILVSAAEYHVFDPESWWSNRESRKVWLLEWAKTVFTFFELAFTEPESGKAQFQGLIPDIWSAGADSVRAADAEPLATFSINDGDSALSADSAGTVGGLPDGAPDTSVVDSAGALADTVKTDSVASLIEESQAGGASALPDGESAKDPLPARKAPRAPRIIAEKPETVAVKSPKESAKKAIPKAKSPAKPAPKKTEKSETRKKKT